MKQVMAVLVLGSLAFGQAKPLVAMPGHKKIAIGAVVAVAGGIVARAVIHGQSRVTWPREKGGPVYKK